MEVVLLIGIQATGKSSFYKEQFFNTHVRINLDMLKTRHREKVLVQACLQAKQSFVVDNTNLTVADRTKYIEPAKAAGFRVAGYYFRSNVEDALRRNRERPTRQRVPLQGVLSAHKKLQVPTYIEGFDVLYYVHIEDEQRFIVEEWSDAV